MIMRLPRTFGSRNDSGGWVPWCPILRLPQAFGLRNDEGVSDDLLTAFLLVMTTKGIAFCDLWIASSFYSSQWQYLIIVIVRANPHSSLRELLATRGNLGIWHNYSIDEFFSFQFLYLLLVVNSFSFLWMNKLLVVVDCFVSLAMTAHTNSSLRRTGVKSGLLFLLQSLTMKD